AFSWVRLIGGHTGVWRTGPLTIPAVLSRCTVHVTALYRRQVWLQVGGYDSAFTESGEDWDFWISAAQAGLRAGEVPEPLVDYRRTANGREQRARDPEIAARVMRTLVRKHAKLYAQHLDDSLAGLYAQKARLSLSLERIYDLPLLRWVVK